MLIYFFYYYRTIETSHVVRLIGVVTNQFPQYVILEFMEKGDLKRYLMGLRKKPPRQAVSFFFRPEHTEKRTPKNVLKH